MDLSIFGQLSASSAVLVATHFLDLFASRLASIVGESLSEIIFYQMLFSAIELASYMFAMDETQGMSLTNVTAVIGALTVLLPTYLFCKLSENVTAKLWMTGNAFYECSWYRLSAKQQKLVLLPIQRSSQEFRMNGLGIVDCSLAIFTTVIVMV